MSIRLSPFFQRYASILIISTVYLAACQSLVPAPPTSTRPAPEPVYTSAALTAAAGLTQQAAALEGTATPAPPTATPAPVTETSTPSPNQSPSPTPGGGDDKAAFVLDVTIPDGTTFSAGTDFVKTWRLKNVGTSTWTGDYDLVFYSGSQMSAPPALPVPEIVEPGQTVDLALALTAPQESGLQRGYFMLRSPAGELFGIGPQNDQAFYVEIIVTGGDGSPTATPFTTGGDVVSALSLGVSPSSYAGTCPFSFVFTAQVTMASPARITIQLEAGSEDPGYQFTLPSAQTYDLGTGTSTYTYFLDLTGQTNGWARVRITAPEDVTSNTVNFSIDCD